MKINAILLYINPLSALAALLLSANVAAESALNEVEVSANVSQIEANETAEPVVISPVTLEKPAINTAEVKKGLNNPSAQLVAIALKYKDTEVANREYAKVAETYCRAAKFGDADAQYALGWMYQNGRGVAADEKVAAQLYTMAAEQGHTRAKSTLATLADVKPESTLLACLLPDPPPEPMVTTLPSVDGTNAENKGISEKTAALFYSKASILKIVNKLAPKYEIDANLAMSFIAVESNFNVQATSPKNAQGLMQLIPATAQRFVVKDAYKAEENIKGGLAYLRYLLAYFQGDVELVAAAYNAGEGAVEKYKGVPPYAETQLYVKKIARLYNNNSHPYKENWVKESPFLKTKKTSG